MKLKLFLILIICVFAACQPDKSGGSGAADADPEVAITGSNSDFLVKLTSSMSAESSNPGDAVTGVVIDPVPLRGGRVKGTIQRADRSFLNFTFDSVSFEGKIYPFKSRVTGVVSSKGNAGQDDFGQRIRLVGGGIIAYGTTTAINEGAEIYFIAWEE